MKAKKVANSEGELIGYRIYCLGCEENHIIYTEPVAGRYVWGFNGDVEKPTFTPSLLIRSGHYVPEHNKDSCWCTYNKEQEEKGEEPSGFECGICHTFITDGKIQYLTDCTHKLAGQTIDLPEIDTK